MMSIYQEIGFSPDQEHLSEATLYNIARTFTLLHRAFQRSYSHFTLTPAKLNVLAVVRHLGGTNGMPQRDIAERLIISGSNVTGLIDRLEKDGLLVRRATADDRRVKLIAITPKGAALLDRLWPAHLQQAESAISILSEQEQQQLIRLLTKLRAWIQRQNGSGSSQGG